MDYTENTSTERRALELLKATVRQLEGLMQEAIGAGDDESLACVAPWAAKLRALLDVDGAASTRRARGATPTKNTKESNQAVLHEAAERLGVKEFLEEVASFIEARMPSYRLPHETGYYSFTLHEWSEGRPTARRRYATLYLDSKQPGSLLLTLTPRAVEIACDDAVSRVLYGCASGFQEPEKSEKLQRHSCRYVQRRMANDFEASRAAAFSDSRWLEAKRGRRRGRCTL